MKGRCRKRAVSVEFSTRLSNNLKLPQNNIPEFNHIARCSFALVVALQMLLSLWKSEVSLQYSGGYNAFRAGLQRYGVRFKPLSPHQTCLKGNPQFTQAK
jgi:hypothetical protein